jgi:hypothetical protein
MVSSRRTFKMATPIALLSFRWHRFRLAETDASDHASAACYRFLKHIGVHAIVVAELKLRDVQRHIFCAHLVERADHAALEQRPKAFNRVRVNRADHVLLFVVLHGLARVFDQAIVNLVIVSRQQADFVGDDFAHEALRRFGVDVAENPSDHVALALYRANDRRLAGGLRAGHAVVPLFPVTVLVLAADKRFVNLDYAAKLFLRRDQCRADFVAHGMGRLVAAEAHHALDLERAHSLLARQHQMGDAEPVSEGLLGVLEDRPGQTREPIALRRAFPALPVKRLVARGVVQVWVAATRAVDALRPAACDQVAKASLIVTDRKAVLELSRGHLRDWLRTICHGGYPLNLSVGAYCHA